MYLLATEYCTHLHKDFDEIYATLRENGCHSPTRESISRVFRAARGLAMLAKLEMPTGYDTVVIQTEMLLKQLDGPNKTLDLTGNGFEFSGWYTEIATLLTSGLLNYHTRHTMSITNRFKNMIRDNPEDKLEEALFDYLESIQILDKIRIDIVNRAKRFELVHLLLAGMYAGRNPLSIADDMESNPTC